MVLYHQIVTTTVCLVTLKLAKTIHKPRNHYATLPPNCATVYMGNYLKTGKNHKNCKNLVQSNGRGYRQCMFLVKIIER